MKTERMMRRASATHARNQRMTDSPHRRALLASLVLNGLIRAAGAAALGLAVQRSLDGAASRGALAAAFVAAAIAIVWLRSRERSDAARLGAEYAYSLGAALDADRLGPTRRWVAALARGATAVATVLGALGALAVLDVAFALAAGAVVVLGALGVAAACAAPRAMDSRARAIGAVSEACAFLVPAAVVVVGAGRVSAGSVAAGLVVAAILAAALRDAGRVPEAWADAALENVRSSLAASTGTAQWPLARPLPDGPGWLVFDSATVDGVLEGVEVAAEPGAVIAVIGDAGAGKSTLVSLASRLLDPDSGHVTLDGHDLRSLTLDSLRRAVGVAGPALPLLRGDMEANLRYRWPDAPPSEIERVLHVAGLDDVLPATPHEWLSEAQQGRLAIARALVGDPRVLLVDDVDALLDAGAAGVLDRVIARRRGRATTILVTKWPELAQTADVVWRFSEGRLIAVGPPQRVLT